MIKKTKNLSHTISFPAYLFDYWLQHLSFEQFLIVMIIGRDSYDSGKATHIGDICENMPGIEFTEDFTFQGYLDSLLELGLIKTDNQMHYSMNKDVLIPVEE